MINITLNFNSLTGRMEMKKGKTGRNEKKGDYGKIEDKENEQLYS